MGNVGEVIVVDDDAGIRNMVSLALATAGYEVRAADGLQPVERGNARVLILDVRLRGRSAQELLAAQPELAELPIVLMTASAAARDRAQGLPAPVAILHKPFDLEVLETAVRTALATRRPAHGSEPPLEPAEEGAEARDERSGA